MIELFSIYFLLLFLTLMIAYRGHSLSFSGAFSASVVGMSIYLGFHVKGLIILGIFFVSSSYWSKYKATVKRSMEEKLAKGSKRDYRQVFANGGAASFFSLLYYFQRDPIWLMGFAVCLASANSDTWSSEIGSLSKKGPFSIRSFKRVDRGTSGAISGLGNMAGLAGSFLIAIVCFGLFNLPITWMLGIFIFGAIGNVFDTLIGAFYQQVYVCKVCGLETEKKSHCEYPTTRIKGFKYVDNDMVNFVSGLLTALLAIGVVYLTN